MNKNAKLLTIGLILFALSLILKALQIINTTVSTIVILLGFAFIVVSLYNLVFKRLRKK
ncbi:MULTISPECIES: hypothetical protein [unclassified Myroides]|uniref:hypothetical protein n=1 Tax=unclassified Myroides TaxID=2642485 RepID=UPI0015FDCEE0|nr:MULTISPECIES: hypothetical protein [unclassified Myroides]MBB1149008.1 hypothetical protein [Myroides sp. NP-2]MDM1406230.1 hypothetical protein [Myroides sp. DF42-4-2]